MDIQEEEEEEEEEDSSHPDAPLSTTGNHSCLWSLNSITPP